MAMTGIHFKNDHQIVVWAQMVSTQWRGKGQSWRKWGDMQLTICVTSWVLEPCKLSPHLPRETIYPIRS